MATSVMGFLKDEFGWKHRPAAWFFGGLVLLLGLPCVIWFQEGVFDEFDYWAGTVSLVVFALFEIILFAWVFGMEKGWEEINHGADIKVPRIFRFIIKYITPLFLGFVFFKSLPTIWENLTKEVPWQVWVGRGILLLLFMGIAWFVRLAYLKRKKQLDHVKP